MDGRDFQTDSDGQGAQVEASVAFAGLARRCREEDVTASVYETSDLLLGLRASIPDPKSWKSFLDDPSLSELKGLLRQDPFSARCVDRPRGYAGDAVMLDMAYRRTPVPKEVSRVGALAYEATTNSPGSRSVRYRKDHLAEWMDDVAQDRPGLRIASIACGHLRELERSEAYRTGEIRHFLALDQDTASLDVVKAAYDKPCVATRTASLMDFVRATEFDGQFDAVYAAGLFDYLDDGLARRTIAGFMKKLRPGGRLLVANLTPSLIDIGYMEAIMDWWLIYRSQEQLHQLATKAAERTPGVRIRSYRDVIGNVAFSELTVP